MRTTHGSPFVLIQIDRRATASAYLHRSIIAEATGLALSTRLKAERKPA